jgi:hypothetical protein
MCPAPPDTSPSPNPMRCAVMDQAPVLAMVPEGDQLGAAGPLRLYLTKNDDGTFQTLRPFDGVESGP